MQDDHTRNVAGQPPAQQRQARRRQREEQAGNVPATLYDIDLRNIPLGFNMPALSDNAQAWCESDERTDVLRRPEGCTIEALVVNPRACCKSDESVQAVQQLPWWPRAVQMRSLVAAGRLTLGHWGQVNNDGRDNVPAIRDVLDVQVTAQRAERLAQRLPATDHTHGASDRAKSAEGRASQAESAMRTYIRSLHAQSAAESSVLANILGRATSALRYSITGLRTVTSYTKDSVVYATEAAFRFWRRDPRSGNYGQECRQRLSAAVSRALYDSVYKATWGALQYSTDEKTNGCITYAERETALPVTLDDQGIEVAEDHRVHTAQHANGTAMLTLYSQRGWPTSWGSRPTYAENSPVNVPVPQRAEQSRDPDVIDDAEHRKLLYVRYEVQRAWRNVACVYNEHNRNARLSTLPLGHVPPATTSTKRTGVCVGLFVLGTPGIGKTMSGNYMVYRLLHDVNAPPCIAFAVGDCVFVFDKRYRMVSCYKRDDFDRYAFSEWCGTQCVYIHDCGQGKYKLDQGDGPKEALMLALSSPNKSNYDKALRKPGIGATARAIVVNSWSYRELCCVAPLVGVDLDTLRERVEHVGPLPRHVYDAANFAGQILAVAGAVNLRAYELQNLSGIVAKNSIKYGEGEENPTNALYDMYRVRSDERQQDDDVPPHSDEWQFRLFAEKIPSMLLSKLMRYHI